MKFTPWLIVVKAEDIPGIEGYRMFNVPYGARQHKAIWRSDDRQTVYQLDLEFDELPAFEIHLKQTHQEVADRVREIEEERAAWSSKEDDDEQPARP